MKVLNKAPARAASLLLGVGLLAGVPGSAAAQVAEGETFGEPQTLCTIADTRLPEVSGATDTAEGLYVANDKGAVLYRLDDRCRVAEVLPFRGVTAIDPEEVTLGPDGTIWLVDSGGNRVPRTSVTLYGRTVDGDVRRARFTYPDDVKRDAEAAFITLDNELVLFSKERGRSEIFQARLPGRDDEPVPFESRGFLDVERLGGRPGAEGSLFLTGAALSPDGLHVALRTYTDVLEWKVGGGDVVRSMLSEAPAPSAKVSQQKQGEAITYATDAESILALSEQLPSPVLSVAIRRAAERAPQTGDAAPASSPIDLRLPTWALVSVGVPAVLLLLGLVVAFWRRRSRSRLT